MTRLFISTRMVIFCLLLLLPALASANDRDNKKKKKTQEPAVVAMEPDEYPMVYRDKKLYETPWTSNNFTRKILTGNEGIDVSHYQGLIDWATVAASNKISYAFVKATESNNYIDEYYTYNIAEGRKYGLTMGCYHFFRSNVSMEQQFKHMTSVVKAADIDLVPIIDVEAANGAGIEAFVTKLKVFMKMVEEHYGRPPILYTYVNFYNKYLAYRGFDHYPLMIAFYNDYQPQVIDGNKFIMWQYTSHGRIEGIKGNVDRSRFTNGFTINDILY